MVFLGLFHWWGNCLSIRRAYEPIDQSSFFMSYLQSDFWSGMHFWRMLPSNLEDLWGWFERCLGIPCYDVSPVWELTVSLLEKVWVPQQTSLSFSWEGFFFRAVGNKLWKINLQQGACASELLSQSAPGRGAAGHLRKPSEGLACVWKVCILSLRQLAESRSPILSLSQLMFYLSSASCSHIITLKNVLCVLKLCGFPPTLPLSLC